MEWLEHFREATKKMQSSENIGHSEDLDFQTFASEILNVFALPKERTTNTEENPMIWEYEIARHFYELGKNQSNMRLIWHHNTWPWGKSVKVIKSDGSAIVDMSFEDNNPGVCYLSGLSVIEPQRRKGIAKYLIFACESYCRERGIFRIDLNSVLTDWVQDFYKKCGYIPLKEEDGFMQMYKLLNARKED